MTLLNVRERMGQTEAVHTVPHTLDARLITLESKLDMVLSVLAGDTLERNVAWSPDGLVYIDRLRKAEQDTSLPLASNLDSYVTAQHFSDGMHAGMEGVVRTTAKYLQKLELKVDALKSSMEQLASAAPGQSASTEIVEDYERKDGQCAATLDAPANQETKPVLASNSSSAAEDARVPAIAKSHASPLSQLYSHSSWNPWNFLSPDDGLNVCQCSEFHYDLMRRSTPIFGFESMLEAMEAEAIKSDVPD